MIVSDGRQQQFVGRWPVHQCTSSNKARVLPVRLFHCPRVQSADCVAGPHKPPFSKWCITKSAALTDNFRIIKGPVRAQAAAMRYLKQHDVTDDEEDDEKDDEKS